MSEKFDINNEEELIKLVPEWYNEMLSMVEGWLRLLPGEYQNFLDDVIERGLETPGRQFHDILQGLSKIYTAIMAYLDGVYFGESSKLNVDTRDIYSAIFRREVTYRNEHTTRFKVDEQDFVFFNMMSECRRLRMAVEEFREPSNRDYEKMFPILYDIQVFMGRTIRRMEKYYDYKHQPGENDKSIPLIFSEPGSFGKPINPVFVMYYHFEGRLVSVNHIYCLLSHEELDLYINGGDVCPITTYYQDNQETFIRTKDARYETGMTYNIKDFYELVTVMNKTIEIIHERRKVTGYKGAKNTVYMF